MALIQRNFFPQVRDYRDFFGGHHHPSKIRWLVQYPIYIWRDFEPVSKSLFNMRKRFGLDIEDYQQFLRTKYYNMQSKNVEPGDSQVTFINGENQYNCHKIYHEFQGIDLTPEEWWLEHQKAWCKKRKVYVIKYEVLISDFIQEMKRLGDFLGLEQNSFVNVRDKVGWVDTNPIFNGVFDGKSK